jgi:hypothetical protein
VLLWLSRSLDRLLRKRLVLAGAVFLFGAVGLEALGGVISKTVVGLSSQIQHLLYNLTALAEELAEITGVIIAIWAIVASLRITRGPAGLSIPSPSAAADTSEIPAE